MPLLFRTSIIAYNLKKFLLKISNEPIEWRSIRSTGWFACLFKLIALLSLSLSLDLLTFQDVSSRNELEMKLYIQIHNTRFDLQVKLLIFL